MRSRSPDRGCATVVAQTPLGIGYVVAMNGRAFVICTWALGACTPSRQETPAPTTSQSAAQPPAAQPAATQPLAARPAPAPQEAACSTDRDCRAFSHYCDGCFCVPLAKSSADLKCRGAPTSCFVDPCRAKKAVCRKGTCTLVGEADK